ncbi:zinc ribbon domain-containing protein [Pseudoxanthomonas sp. Soil82]|uniref:FmdB family zinc ribbon protein n=1 Tax=Pseudoxanthomonas sp. Soil82 TaxID=3157341 RepID=UPI00338FD1D4
MPIYAFQCTECGHSFDRLQKLSDADPDTCPSCGATGGVRRQLTAPAFRLSGSGWYETDFKKDGDRKRNLADGGEGAAKSESKAESTPAAAPATAAAPAKGDAGTPAAKPSAPGSAS